MNEGILLVGTKRAVESGGLGYGRSCVLLEHSANVGAEDENDRTPLHTAIETVTEYGRKYIMCMLLKHGVHIPQAVGAEKHCYSTTGLALAH